MKYKNSEPRDFRLKKAEAKDAHWGLLRNIIADLSDSTGFVVDDEVHRAIRSRDPRRLLKSTSQYSPQRIVDAAVENCNISKFFAGYQIASFLKKFPFKGQNTRTPAIEAFLEYERICKIFNTSNFRALIGLDKAHPDYLGIISEIRDDIAKVLGDVPDESVLFDLGRHGPGQTVGGLDGGRVTTYYKFSDLPYSVTEGARPMAKRFIESDPRWIGALMNWYREFHEIPMYAPIDLEDFWSAVFRVVDFNQITTVPKSVETDRTIAIEPRMNIFLQLSVGDYITKRLRRWGITLNDQTRNNDLALEGSETGELATLDLKGASETASLRIVTMYLPATWVDLLLSLRCPRGQYQLDKLDYFITYSKISSTGNGFTFALESLIFAALARVAMRRSRCSGKMAVFGDDIIVPTASVPMLVSLLSLSGFLVNQDKSFISGGFRESCGTDFLFGQAVRPMFLKRALHDAMDVFYVLNSLGKLERDYGLFFDNSKAFLENLLPDWCRQLRGPVSEDLEGYIHDSHHRLKRRKGYPGYWRLQRNAVIYNGEGKDFFFRKLMVPLRGNSSSLDWNFSSFKVVGSGNAFDVVKREHTRCVLKWVSGTDLVQELRWSDNVRRSRATASDSPLVRFLRRLRED